MFVRRVKRGLSLSASVAGLLALTGCGRQFVLLHPAGTVANSELHLMETVSLAMAAVVLFVLVLFGITLVRFRDRPGNRAPYRPELGGHPRLEVVLFLIPILIVAFIAVPTVQKTFALGRPPVAAGAKGKGQVVIDVTSLDWKWVFEYPGQHIATVNKVTIPSGKPVLFKLTSDAPMNAFWVPRLGGMETAIPGRVLPLWLEATQTGTFLGRSANFSGKDFAKMTFKVHAVTPAAFARWVHAVQKDDPPLTMAAYRALKRPGLHRPEAYASYPAHTFPATGHGFTLTGGRYTSSSFRTFP